MRLFLIIIIQISFWATTFAQKDISVSTSDSPEHQFILTVGASIGFQSDFIFLNNSQGVLLDYQTSSPWFLGTGLRFSAIRDRFNSTISEEFVNDDGINVFRTVTPESATYIQVPLRISHRKSKFQFTFELSNNFLFNVRGTTSMFNPLSSFFPVTDRSTKKIESTGFRKYHLRAHLYGLRQFENGFGFGLEVFRPITKIAWSAEKIPTGLPLLNRVRPGGIAFHLFYGLNFN